MHAVCCADKRKVSLTGKRKLKRRPRCSSVLLAHATVDLGVGQGRTQVSPRTAILSAGKAVGRLLSPAMQDVAKRCVGVDDDCDVQAFGASADDGAKFFHDGGVPSTKDFKCDGESGCAATS